MYHLIHPAIVHFTVAFVVLGGVCEAWGILRRRPALERFGSMLVVIGVITVIPTVVTGYVAANSLTVPAHAQADLDLHERVGLVILAVLILTQFWRGWFGGRVPDSHRMLYALVLLVGVALVLATSVLGGHLVYEHGLGISPR